MILLHYNRENYTFPRIRRGSNFSQGGPTFSRGEGPNADFYRNPHNLWFSRGVVRTTPLDLHIGSTISEGGRERERCGLFLKGKTLFLQSVIWTPTNLSCPPPPPMLLDLYQNCYFSPIKHILWVIVGRFYMRILCMSLQNNRLEV